MDLYDCSGLLIKISQNQFTRSLEKLYDHLNYTLTDDQELINMYRAADHRRAELVSGGRLFDLGRYRSPSGTMSSKESSDRL